jgi:hypothetical protein
MLRSPFRLALASLTLAGLLAAALPATAGSAASISVTVAVIGMGKVTSLPPGIDCGATCAAPLPSPVTLTAIPAAGWSITSWSGAGCSTGSTCQVNADATVTATFARSHRPDAWIKWCGSGDTCEHAPPHPYRGEGVFNTSGRSQTVSAGLEEGNDIRFWIMIENDGVQGDTFRVKGCSGNPSFSIRAVNIGALRRSQYAPIITKPFEHGTARFSFPPAATSHDVVITLDIWEHTPIQGLRYTCPITVSSVSQPTAKDTVVAKMVTT